MSTNLVLPLSTTSELITEAPLGSRRDELAKNLEGLGEIWARGRCDVPGALEEQAWGWREFST